MFNRDMFFPVCRTTSGNRPIPTVLTVEDVQKGEEACNNPGASPDTELIVKGFLLEAPGGEGGWISIEIPKSPSIPPNLGPHP